MRRFGLMLAGALAFAGVLAGCQPTTDESGENIPPPSPILYELADKKGQPAGWLFGTIHALPRNLEWQTPELERVIEQAGMLVVEIGDLADTRSISATFNDLATTPNMPELTQRVGPVTRPALSALIERSDYDADDFGNIETWAAALMLAQVESSGSAAHGADKVLLNRFPENSVQELEGTRRQLSIFDRLPEQDQADLLTGVIREFAERGKDPNKLRRAWLTGDEATLIEATRSGILADAELYEALLVQRNRDWIPIIVDALENDTKPLVAVGAAHLVGPDGLATLLEAEGYTLTRLQ